jgi:acyl-CoA dehydrogenase
MSDYQAPTNDMLFALYELAGMEDLASLPGCEEASRELVEMVVEEAGKFSAGVLEPLNMPGDQQGSEIIDRGVKPADGFGDAYRQMVDAGWVSVAGNPDFGGQGLPGVLAAAVNETIMAANLSMSLCPMLSQGAVKAIYNHGSDELKQTWLEKLVTGEWTGTMNLTEPQAGSDLAAVRSRAVPNGDHYLISGTKIYITWGDHDMTDNIVHLVLARTPEAPAGTRGISLFIVPKYLLNDDGSPGEHNDAYPVSVEHKLGIHASPTCVMSFGDNGGAIGYLIGEENKGLAYMFTMMNHARIDVGLQGLGVSERAYQHAVAYAKDRVQGKVAGQPATIIKHPDVRRMLMQMKALTESMRGIVYLATVAGDIAKHHPNAEVTAAAAARQDLLTPITKGWLTETANEITSLGVQVHGGMGFIEETGAAQYLRDARILPIYEGTNGIQALDLVGRKLIRDGGKMMSALIDDMEATLAKLEAVQDLLITKSALRRGVNTLKSATEWLLEGRDSEQLAEATSFNYMMLASVVVGGWV